MRLGFDAIRAGTCDAKTGPTTDTGGTVEILAPGELVDTIAIDGTPTTSSEVGIVGAQVAGALTLMVEYNRAHDMGYTNEELRSFLNDSAVDIGAGIGKADVSAAIDAMVAAAPEPTTLGVLLASGLVLPRRRRGR